MKIKTELAFKLKTIEKLFGVIPSGESIFSYQLANKNGMKLNLINLGATITELLIPLKNGEKIDVVLGFDDLESYLKSFELKSAPYFGATVGRFAGRINNATFVSNGITTVLDKNNNGHSLHGGNNGFSQAMWKVKEINNAENPSITLTLFSPNGDSKYPGDLTVDLTYTLSEENELILEYKATTTQDTIVNLTHHSYFNLDGHSSNIEDQELFINASQMLETTNENIPTGRFLEIKNNPFDFSTPKKAPSKIDNTFVIDTKDELAASLFNKNNNLKMTVYTNQPGVHIYVGGNCFNMIKGKEKASYHPLSGICFETQNFPDAPNHSHFPNAVLKKEEKYVHKTIYKFQSL
ncbi:aldose epimerase family protein [Flavobacterium myungsuense]|uniref:Aldose 1-epimerase n=1 Tax=Flavobacterium myungsuense TaxID=651823 RepID=A0ABW3J317_9FLAO